MNQKENQFSMKPGNKYILETQTIRMLSGYFTLLQKQGPTGSFSPCCGLWVQDLGYTKTLEILWNLVGVAKPRILPKID